MLTLFITSESSKSERRFNSSLSLENFKSKLEPITGVSGGSMKLEVFDSKDNFIKVLNEESSKYPLSVCGLNDFYRVNVVDTNPFRIKNQYTDTSLVEKFELTDVEYDKRLDSVRNFKKNNKLGRFAESTKENMENEYKEDAESISVGSRFCLIDDDVKRGQVKYVGTTNFKPGYWIGVEYDEPIGKHDGKVDGFQYFSCKQNHGSFLRPNKIIVGDFPELDLFNEDDIEEM